MVPDDGEATARGVKAHADGTGDAAAQMRRARPHASPAMVSSLAIVQRRMFGLDVAPQRIGRYVLLDRIGEGGMGVVHRAYDPELDRKVAIKLVRPNAQDAGGAERLKREAQALARVSHPNVVGVFDVGALEDAPIVVDPNRASAGPLVFIVMELVDGISLRDWLLARPRPWRAVVRLFAAAARGLAAAHAHDIVHRDFKPTNVIVDAHDAPRVVDFGLARAADSEVAPRAPTIVSAASDEPASDSSSSRLATPLTLTGTVIGTPAYMAPEQLLARAVDPRADQYGVCVALYEWDPLESTCRHASLSIL